MNSFSLFKLHNTCYINAPLMIPTNTEVLFRDNSGSHFEVHPSRFFPMHLHTYESAAAAKSLQSCPTLRPHRRQPTRLPRPWDSPGKNSGVGCHFLLQCMQVKSEGEVTQSCPTFSDPMDCSPPGFSVYGIFQARVLEWVAIAFSEETL